MTHSVKYLLMFIVIFFTADILMGLFMERVFPEITFGTYGKVNKSLTIDKEILIFGSSRAMHHYNPEVINHETGMSCYNTGLGGHGLLYNYALLKEIVNNQKPELIILDLSPNVIVDPQVFSKMNIFMPYYFNYPAFNEIIKLDPGFSILKTIFKTYIYNSTLYDYFRSEISDELPGNGFIGLEQNLNTAIYTPMHLLASETITNTKKTYFDKFINIAKENNIKIVCIVSPTFEKFDTDNQIIGELQNLATAKGVDFYNYSDFSVVYGKAEYFKDQLHLNIKGANMFSRIVAEKIIKSSGK